MIRSFNKI